MMIFNLILVLLAGYVIFIFIKKNRLDKRNDEANARQQEIRDLQQKIRELEERLDKDSENNTTKTN